MTMRIVRNPPGRKRTDRKRVSGKSIKPVVAGQIEADEAQRFETIAKRETRLTRSMIVRLAILRLLEDDAAGRFDWNVNVDDQRKRIGL